MLSSAALIYLVILIVGISLLVIYSREGKLLRSLVFTVITGFVALAVVLAASSYLSLGVAVTPLSLLMSGVLGVPGVFLMLILNLI